MKRLQAISRNRLKSHIQSKLNFIYGKHVYHVDRVNHPHSRKGKQLYATITHHYPKHIVVNNHVHDVMGDTSNKKLTLNAKKLSKRLDNYKIDSLARSHDQSINHRYHRPDGFPEISRMDHYQTTTGFNHLTPTGLNSQDKILYRSNGLIKGTKPTYFVSTYGSTMQNGAIQGKYSENEQLTARYLRSLGINYGHGQYLHIHGADFRNKTRETKRALHLDFFIPKEFTNGKQDLGIEVDGTQHNKPVKGFGGISQFAHQVKNDQKKNLYCKRHHIKLIRIPMYKLHNKAYMKKLTRSVMTPQERLTRDTSSIPGMKNTLINATLDQDLLPNLSFNKIQKADLDPKLVQQGVKRINAKGNHIANPKLVNKARFECKKSFIQRSQIGNKLRTRNPNLTYNEKLHYIVSDPKYEKDFDPYHYSRTDADFIKAMNKPFSKRQYRQDQAKNEHATQPMSKQKLEQDLAKATQGVSEATTQSMNTNKLNKHPFGIHFRVPHQSHHTKVSHHVSKSVLSRSRQHGVQR